MCKISFGMPLLTLSCGRIFVKSQRKVPNKFQKISLLLYSIPTNSKNSRAPVVLAVCCLFPLPIVRKPTSGSPIVRLAVGAGGAFIKAFIYPRSFYKIFYLFSS